MIISPEHKLVENAVVIEPTVDNWGTDTVFVAVPEQPVAGVAVTLKVVSETIPLMVKVAIPVALFLIACCEP